MTPDAASTSTPTSPSGDLAPDFADRLLAYIRERFASPTIVYRDEPSAVSGGFDTGIYAFSLTGTDGRAELSGPLILRAFREGGGATDPLYETAVHNAVRELKFPAPRIVLTCEDTAAIGRTFVVMERCPGRIMLDDLRSSRIFSTFATLGDLHARLHSLDTSRFAAMTANAGQPNDGRVSFDDVGGIVDEIKADGLAPGVAWLNSNVPAPTEPVICHGDFHPLNVLVDGGKVTGVIDWAGARLGPSEWDIGATMALLTQGPVEAPRMLLAIAGRARRWLSGRYLAGYRKARPFDLRAVEYYEALRYISILAEVAGHIQARAGVIASWDRPSAFSDPRVQAGILARVREITGVAVALPPDTAR